MNSSGRILLMIFPLLLLSGCIRPLIPEESAPQTRSLPVVTITDEVLDRRIEYFSRLLETKDLSVEEREAASKLLDTYRAVKEIPPPERAKENLLVIKSLFNALSDIEIKYFSRIVTPEESTTSAVRRFSVKREEIIDKYLEGDYQGVINDCMELEDTLGKETLTPEMGLYFALSLAKRGLIEEAIKIGEGVLRQLQGKPDTFHLRSAILDWRLALGQNDKASRAYDKLLEDFNQRESIIKRAQERLGDEKQWAKSRPQETDEPTVLMTNLAGEFKGLKGLFDEVEKLLRKKEFQEAKILLLRHRIRLEKGPEMDAVDKALNAIDLSEERYHRDKDMRASFRDGLLKTAARMIENEEYEEAISRIEYLEEEQGRSVDTIRLKGMAIEKLINRERNRAATLFLRAKRSNDPLKKKELLASAHAILKNIVDKYPSSPLNTKVKDHIRRVEGELLKLTQ